MSQRDHRPARSHRGPRFIPQNQNQNDHCPLVVDRKNKVYEQLTARKNRESVQALKAAEIAFPVTLRFLLRVETVKYLKNVFNGSSDGDVSVNGFRVRYTLEEDASDKSPEGTLTFCGHFNSCLTLLETWDYEFFKPDQFWNEYYGGAANLCIKTRHLVHEKVVGMLIGVRGSQVDNLSFQHDCDIQVFGLTLPKSSERVACVVGRISDTVRVIRDMYLTILAKPNELLRHVLHYSPSNYVFNVSKEGGGVFESQSAERQRLIQSRGPQHRRRHNASQRSSSTQLKRSSKPSRELNLPKPIQKTQSQSFGPSGAPFQPPQPPPPPPQSNPPPIPWTPLHPAPPGQNFVVGAPPPQLPPRNDMPMLMLPGDRTLRPFRPPMPVGGPGWAPRFLGPPPPPSPIQHPHPPPVPSPVAMNPFGQPRAFSKPPKTNLAKYPSVFRPLACPIPPRFPPTSVNPYPGPPVALPTCDVRSELSVTPDPAPPLANRRLLKEETLYIISPQRAENNAQLPSDLLLTGATWFRHRNHLHNLGITSDNSLKLSCSLLGSENGPNDQDSLKILSKCVGDVKEWFFDESELANLTSVNKAVEQVLHSRPGQKNARDFWSRFSGKLRESGRPFGQMKSRSFSHLNNSRLRHSVSAKSVPVQQSPVVKTSVSQDGMTLGFVQEKPASSSNDVRKCGLTFTSEVLPEKVTEEIFCAKKTEVPSRRGSSSGGASVDWDESLASSDALEKHSEDSGVHSDEPESSSRSQASEDGGWTEVISSRKCAMRVSVSSRNNKSSLLPRFVHSETTSHHHGMSDLRDQYCKSNHSFFFGTNSLKSSAGRVQRSSAAPMGYARSGGAAQPVLS